MPTRPALVVVALASACSRDRAPPPPPVVIETGAGPMTVDRVQVADEFPPGCDPAQPGCARAVDGAAILVVWLGAATGGDALIDELSSFSIGDGAGWSATAFSGGLLDGARFLAFPLERRAASVELTAAGRAPVTLALPPGR